MCIDFTDLNKCCPKDDLPLARIDKILEKISIITPFDAYCYFRIPEGLPNVGPTFCRMTKVALKDEFGRNVISYIDDIVVASKKKTPYISDLAETFTNVHEVWLKLNPEECIFGVNRGKALGFLVSMKGIEANQDKIKAILQM
jgi:hypothetical protein